MRNLLLATTVTCLPTASLAADWWVVVGYFDHPPSEWDDGILTQGNGLEADLNACGLSAYWDFATKFDGFVKWSGTSFSTAVITGLMARLCRHGKSAEDAFRVLSE